MFVKSSIIPRLVSAFPPKIRQLIKLPTRALNTKCFYCVLKIDYKQQLGLITPIGESARCLSATNETNDLSKAMSGEGDRELNVNYEDVLKAQKDDRVVIIDVREDYEIQETGKLPGSIHIPRGELANALTNLSDEDFEKKYNRKKPSKNTKIILSCRTGRRSALAQSELQKLGFKNVYNYKGGWVDWESKTKA